MRAPQQQLLNLSQPTTYDDGDFFVTSCNEEAYEWIQKWPQWSSHCLILYGPKGSGKTHLAHIWARKANARFVDTTDWMDTNLDQLVSDNPHLILEDLTEGLSQEHLFHLYNVVRQAGGSLLITSSTSPHEWGLTLPDLSSRLKASPWLVIKTADEELLSAMIYKLMADLQIIIPAHVIDYLLKTYDRSFAAIQDAVHAINNYALSNKRKITLPLVKEVLKEI